MNYQPDMGYSSKGGDSIVPVDQSKRTNGPRGLASEKPQPSSTSVMGHLSSIAGEDSSLHNYGQITPGVK